MTIEEFADKYRVKRLCGGKPSKYLTNHVPVDDGDVIEGKAGYISTAMEMCPSGQGIRSRNGILQLSLLAVPRSANRDTLLTNRFKAAEAAGMTLKVRSGAESEWYFDETNPAMCQAAIKIVGASRRKTRILTPEQKDKLVARLQAGRALTPNVGK